MTDRLINHFPAPTHAPGPNYWVRVDDVNDWLAGRIADKDLKNYLKTAKEITDEAYRVAMYQNQAAIAPLGLR